MAAVSLGKIIELKGITSFDDPFVVRFESLGFNDRLLETPVTLHSTVLIGAGAVGNGFVRALSHLRTFGELSIVDPKLVSDGNLNRCLFFDDGDQGQPKADVLAAKAKPSLANLALDPHVKTFGEFRQSKGRVKRVIVAVDSRRVRRSIQKELPIEVLDASTTGIEEVIVHSHRQLTRRACMACIYHHIIDEFSREREIARGLGVTLDDVKEGFIDARVADLIVKSHPDLNAVALIGKSFDSLFKQRCAEQALSNSAGHQVFAPFALVSNFAGALLAVELLRFENGLISDNNPNYFFTSPWRVPNPLARRNRPRYPDCEFCSVPESENALMLVWPELNALNE